MPKLDIDKLNWKGKTILIAEDEEINYLYLETLLQKTGAKILHTWNGEQTVQAVKENPNIDIILMDIKMPILDGFEATKIIKQINPEIIIIAQTAYTLSDDKIKCFDAGCDDYLSKPLRKNLLYQSISNFLN